MINCFFFCSFSNKKDSVRIFYLRSKHPNNWICSDVVWFRLSGCPSELLVWQPTVHISKSIVLQLDIHFGFLHFFSRREIYFISWNGWKGQKNWGRKEFQGSKIKANNTGGSRGGLWRWLDIWSTSPVEKGWGSWACSALSREDLRETSLWSSWLVLG